MFYENVKNACVSVPQPVKAIVCRMQDVLLPPPGAADAVREGRRHELLPDRKGDMSWQDFIRKGTAEGMELPLTPVGKVACRLLEEEQALTLQPDHFYTDKTLG